MIIDLWSSSVVVAVGDTCTANQTTGCASLSFKQEENTLINKKKKKQSAKLCVRWSLPACIIIIMAMWTMCQDLVSRKGNDRSGRRNTGGSVQRQSQRNGSVFSPQTLGTTERFNRLNCSSCSESPPQKNSDQVDGCCRGGIQFSQYTMGCRSRKRWWRRRRSTTAGIHPPPEFRWGSSSSSRGITSATGNRKGKWKSLYLW